MPRSAPQDSQLRSRCEDRIDRLNLPHRFDTQQLQEAIVLLRGKPIILNPLSTLGATDAPCGIRLEMPEVDLLFYEESTSLLHQRHILTHELCHVLCDHAGSLQLNTEAAQALNFNPTLIVRMSGRTSYTTEDEREAEMMATIIQQRIYRESELPATQPARGAESWEALFSSLGQRGRRCP